MKFSNLFKKSAAKDVAEILSEATETKERVVRLSISGMHCGHCVANVKKALEQVTGVVSADVQLSPGSAEVVLGEAGTVEQLEAAVRALGFDAKAQA